MSKEIIIFVPKSLWKEWLKMSRYRKRFAPGYNFYKVLWVFFAGGFLGTFLEITFYLLTTGSVMSRSSMLYGQFSTVWGGGFVLMTVLLHKMSDKRDLSIFLAGAALGGIYEYACSFMLERVISVRFWDYSRIGYNLHGRINLPFCLLWGVTAVLWVKDLYPKFSKWVERLPDRAGRLLTWLFIAAFIVDSVLSGAAIIRTSAREDGIPADSLIEKLIDETYPTDYILERYPNMKLEAE